MVPPSRKTGNFFTSRPGQYWKMVSVLKNPGNSSCMSLKVLEIYVKCIGDVVDYFAPTYMYL